MERHRRDRRMLAEPWLPIAVPLGLGSPKTLFESIVGPFRGPTISQ